MEQKEILQAMIKTMEGLTSLRREVSSLQAISSGIYKSISDSSPEMRKVIQAGFNNALDFIETVAETQGNDMDEMLKEIETMKEFTLGPLTHQHDI